MTGKRRKIALAGIGEIARAQHLPALSAAPGWELAAAVSRSGRVEGVENYTSMAEMLDARPDISAVSLCQPPAARFAPALQALRAGRHVMLEKPPGAGLAECHALEAEAEKSGVTLYAAWHSRMAAQTGAAKSRLAGESVSRVLIEWKEDAARWHPGQTWIFEPGGFGVFDPGINALSILTAVMPGAFRVTESVLFIPENCGAPAAAALKMRHESGAEVTADFDFRQQGPQTWTITFETGGGDLVLSEGGAKLEAPGGPAADTAAAADADSDNPLLGEYPRLYAHMAELVETGASDADWAPMVLTADAFLLGRRIRTEPFYE